MQNEAVHGALERQLGRIAAVFLLREGGRRVEVEEAELRGRKEAGCIMTTEKLLQQFMTSQSFF